jgi:putative PIG3 family NAD(P)H quinone oxidoreductase
VNVDEQMKAILYNGFGGPEVLHLGLAPIPTVRPDDLLVKVHAVGVNRADLSQRKGAYGTDTDFGDSALIGLEIAGEVVELGANVMGFKVGDRVMGVVGGGAYAEFARIDYLMAVHIPEELGYAEAAAIPEAFITAHEALVHLGGLRANETVLIHAAGSGVGTAAVQIAAMLGASVIATAGSLEKLERVRQLGAGRVINYKEQDFCEAVTSLTDGRGVDVVIDFVGAHNFDRNIRSLAYGGRLVQVGLMGGGGDAAASVLPLDVLLFRHLRIFGTVMKSRPLADKRAMTERFAQHCLPMFADRRLAPVIDKVFPFAEAADAHQRMEQNLNVGKIVLTM